MKNISTIKTYNYPGEKDLEFLRETRKLEASGYKLLTTEFNGVFAPTKIKEEGNIIIVASYIKYAEEFMEQPKIEFRIAYEEEVKVEPKIETKIEVKEAKVEPKKEVKEAKVEVKVVKETKAEPKVEVKAVKETKVKAKAEA